MRTLPDLFRTGPALIMARTHPLYIAFLFATLSLCGADARANQKLENVDTIFEAYGRPNMDETNVNHKPRPAVPHRWLSYDIEHVRFVAVPDTRPGEDPPYKKWVVIEYTDLKSAPLNADEVTKRMATAAARQAAHKGKKK
jgi:hypothetical protein